MWLSAVLLTIIFSLVVFLAIFHYITNGRKYWLLRNVPYRTPCPIFGNFGQSILMKKRFTIILQYFYGAYKKDKYVGIFQGRRPSLLVIDLDIVKHIFTTLYHSFGDRLSVETDTQREPLLRNLSNMSGTEWKTMRQIVSPTFSPSKMKAMFPLIAECADTLEKVLLEERSKEVDVPDLMRRFTTDVIGSCAFGIDPGSLLNPQSPFLKMSQMMFQTNRKTILKRSCRSYFPWLFKLLNLKSYSSNVEIFFTSIIKQVLQERRKGTQRPDFIQLMFNVQNSEEEFKMTDELITSNSFMFMLAGLESSSTALSFCLYELARDQELQNTLRDEVQRCYEKYGGRTHEAVTNMRLLNQTILETLRMHPPIGITTRLCSASLTLPGTDLLMTPHDNVIIPISCIQRDPEYFQDPDKFDIERFKDKIPKGFLAFGDGPRCCPGNRFAQLMTMTGLSAILGSYTVEPCEKTTRIEYDPRGFWLKNKGGIWLKFECRKDI